MVVYAHKSGGYVWACKAGNSENEGILIDQLTDTARIKHVTGDELG